MQEPEPDPASGGGAGPVTAGAADPVSAQAGAPVPAGLVAALDFGGTKIAGALVDGAGRIAVRALRATPAREDAETVMGAVASVLAELTASPLWDRVDAVGIGSAGPVDAAAGTVSPVNVPAWRSFPLADRKSVV